MTDLGALIGYGKSIATAIDEAGHMAIATVLTAAVGLMLYRRRYRGIVGLALSRPM